MGGHREPLPLSMSLLLAAPGSESASHVLSLRADRHRVPAVSVVMAGVGAAGRAAGKAATRPGARASGPGRGGRPAEIYGRLARGEDGRARPVQGWVCKRATRP